MKYAGWRLVYIVSPLAIVFCIRTGVQELVAGNNDLKMYFSVHFNRNNDKYCKIPEMKLSEQYSTIEKRKLNGEGKVTLFY